MRFRYILAGCIVIFYFLLNLSSSQNGIITSLKVEPEYSSVSPGERMQIQISLVQLGNNPKKDVKVTVYIKGLQDNAFAKEEQTAALQTQASLIANLAVPNDLEEGSYTIAVEVSDINTGALLSTASQRFIVRNGKDKESFDADKRLYFYALYLLIGGLILLIIILYLQNKMMRNHILVHHKAGPEDIARHRAETYYNVEHK